IRMSYPYPFVSRCSPDHRHLPAFPTRRSSDLRMTEGRTRRSGRANGRRPAKSQAVRAAAAMNGAPGRNRGTRRINPPRTPAGRRSEEHTSELQSRENLVCRLLLEKKKTTTKEA